jgi:hypothetical protein
MSKENDHLTCWYLHKSLNVIAKVSHAVPLVDPVVADVTAVVVFVGFNQTESEQGTVDDFDPIVNIIGISLSSINSDG